mmetsp:Transcript_36972/g.98247  ORF Transcript_36972/g.98247 Transcript_36972/m.98247 type:complete len:350 (-) Transcript_36972:209-1258(-)
MMSWAASELGIPKASEVVVFGGMADTDTSPATEAGNNKRGVWLCSSTRLTRTTRLEGDRIAAQSKPVWHGGTSSGIAASSQKSNKPPSTARHKYPFHWPLACSSGLHCNRSRGGAATTPASCIGRAPSCRSVETACSLPTMAALPSTTSIIISLYAWSRLNSSPDADACRRRILSNSAIMTLGETPRFCRCPLTDSASPSVLVSSEDAPASDLYWSVGASPNTAASTTTRAATPPLPETTGSRKGPGSRPGATPAAKASCHSPPAAARPARASRRPPTGSSARHSTPPGRNQVPSRPKCSSRSLCRLLPSSMTVHDRPPRSPPAQRSEKPMPAKPTSSEPVASTTSTSR